MKIHIVTHDATSNQILARLARDLSGMRGWTVGDTPNSNADINYYFPYLNYDGYHGTKVAAWFTHRETTRPDKIEVWDRVAREVDLRTTSARMYERELAAFGPTRYVTVPLDRGKFKPAPRKPHDRPVIGTSGYVYDGGRKGENLLAALAGALGDRCDFVASGHGWPVRTIEYKWQDVPAFYHGLDVYVCTSLIEGIGYGPLEALACGVPVVIPRGVGVFDELPGVQNLHRYEAGSSDDLIRATREALEEPINRESMIGITARFTLDAWRGEHQAAFDDFLYGLPPEPPRPEWFGHAGVFYVAYGGPARECATRAIASFHRQMPGVPVAMVSDAPGCGEDIFIQNADEDLGGRSVKTKIYDLAPVEWQYVLYLDADTEVVAPIGFLFDILVDGWELAFCLNPAQYVIGREMRRPDNEDECALTFKSIGTEEFIQYNGGVFSFRRNERTARFFRDWHTEWLRYAKRDQAALDRALYAHPLRCYTLGLEWNTITRYCKPEITAGVLHYPMQARRWRGMVNGRLDSSEAWAAVHPGK